MTILKKNKNERYNLNMNGAWICPDGKIHWTNNIQHHSKVIDELGIADKLKNLPIIFAADEIKKHKNTDLAYIAMKIGYIRIVCSQQEFLIQYGKIPFNSDQILSIISVFNFFKSNCEPSIMFFGAEQFEEKFNSFDNLNSLIQFLKK